MMKENSQFNYTYNYRSPARKTVETIISVLKSNKVEEMGIRHVYIQGEHRTATPLPPFIFTLWRLWESIWDIMHLAGSEDDI